MTVEPLANQVYGQAPQTTTATVALASGDLPTGSVQFRVAGADLGAPVQLTDASAVATATSITVTGPPITTPTGDPLPAGSHQVSAVFTPSAPTQVGVGMSSPVTLEIELAATTTNVVVGQTDLTATVATTAPGTGAPTGSVVFTVDGTPVGTAALVPSSNESTATLSYPVPAGKSRQVGAVYATNGNFAGSAGSTARTDPNLVAKVTSTVKPKNGWYSGPVTVAFTCTPGSAPLSGPCPASVTLTGDTKTTTVTRTISGTDGGVATASATVRIDRTKPAVRLSGVIKNKTYKKRPTPRCQASDAGSGVARCSIKTTRKKLGKSTRVTFKATATDKAGNSRTTTTQVKVKKPAAAKVSVVLKGAKKTGKNKYQVRSGRSYSLTVVSPTQPRYLNASKAPNPPTRYGPHAFKRVGKTKAGTPIWKLTVPFTEIMTHTSRWNIGARIGKTTYVIKVTLN